MIEALRATGKAFDERLTRSMLKAASPDPFAGHTATVQQAKPDQGLTYQALVDFMDAMNKQQQKNVWHYQTHPDIPYLDEEGKVLALTLDNDRTIFCHPDALPFIQDMAENSGAILVPLHPPSERMPVQPRILPVNAVLKKRGERL